MSDEIPFIKAMNEDLLEEAVKCLDLSAHSADVGSDLASQLKSIIDHMVIVVFVAFAAKFEWFWGTFARWGTGG